MNCLAKMMQINDSNPTCMCGIKCWKKANPTLGWKKKKHDKGALASATLKGGVQENPQQKPKGQKFPWKLNEDFFWTCFFFNQLCSILSGCGGPGSFGEANSINFRMTIAPGLRCRKKKKHFSTRTPTDGHLSYWSLQPIAENPHPSETSRSKYPDEWLPFPQKIMGSSCEPHFQNRFFPLQNNFWCQMHKNSWRSHDW